MKNVIAIVAIVVIAILGLSSYNTNDIEVKRNESNSTLLASLNNGGNTLTGGTNTGGTNTGGTNTGGSNKKLD